MTTCASNAATFARIVTSPAAANAQPNSTVVGITGEPQNWQLEVLIKGVWFPFGTGFVMPHGLPLPLRLHGGKNVIPLTSSASKGVVVVGGAQAGSSPHGGDHDLMQAVASGAGPTERVARALGRGRGSRLAVPARPCPPRSAA